MSDQARVIGGGLFGAVVGTVAAYLLFTDEGRHKLNQLSPTVDDLSRVLQDMRAALGRLGEFAAEGRRAADEVRTAFRGVGLDDHTTRWQ